MSNSRHEKVLWVSWEQDSDDYRPLTYPPHEQFLGWWCSGRTGEGVPILCAWVHTTNSATVVNKLKQDWPEWDGWRFIEEKELPTVEQMNKHGRFPVEDDWMVERFEKYFENNG